MPGVSLSRLPWALVIFRVIAGPLMIAVAWRGGPVAGPFCAALLSLGVLSDIFDGVIARRLRVATPALRTADSRADVLFWFCALSGLLILWPEMLGRLWLPAVGLAALELGNHAFSLIKFGREASPHHYLSKAFGLGLWLLFSQLYLTGDLGPLLWIIVAIGVASQLEAAAITARLSAWRCDVPSIWNLRRETSR